MSTVDIRSKQVEGVVIIYPGPYLNQLRGMGIERLCLEMLANGIRKLIVNFEQTELINSIGISILLGVIEAVSDSSGVLVLSNLSASNRDLFEVLGLVTSVRIAPTEEAALAMLCQQAEQRAN